jgi:hypothetical protein
MVWGDDGNLGIDTSFPYWPSQRNELCGNSKIPTARHVYGNIVRTLDAFIHCIPAYIHEYMHVCSSEFMRYGAE